MDKTDTVTTKLDILLDGIRQSNDVHTLVFRDAIEAKAELDKLKKLVQRYSERADFWCTMCP